MTKVQWNEDGRAYFETPRNVPCWQPHLRCIGFHCKVCDGRGYVEVAERTWIPEFDAPRPPEDWTPPSPDAIVAGAIKKRENG